MLEEIKNFCLVKPQEASPSEAEALGSFALLWNHSALSHGGDHTLCEHILIFSLLNQGPDISRTSELLIEFLHQYF